MLGPQTIVTLTAVGHLDSGIETVPSALWPAGLKRTDHSLQAPNRAEVVLPFSKELLCKGRVRLSVSSLAMGATALVGFSSCKSPVRG